MKTSVNGFTRIDEHCTFYSINEIEVSACIRVEKDVDLVLKNLKLKKLGQPHDEVLLTSDSRFEHYKANEDRIILKDGLLFWRCYGKTGNVKYYQKPTLKHFFNVVLRNLHGDVG